MDKIVLIVDACQNTPNYNYCLMDALERNGQDVIYATTKFAYEDITPPAKIKVRYCFFYLARLISRVISSRRVRRVFRGIEYPFDLAALLAYILIHRIRVVHFMWTVFNNLDYWAIRAMQAMGCKVIFTAHNPFPHEEKSSSMKSFSQIYSQVDNIIALTDFTRDKIVHKAGVDAEKISVIPHGDFGYIFSQCGFNVELAENVKLAAAGRKVVAFLGLIRPYKGLNYFIKAMPLIKKQISDSFFLVAGSVLVGCKESLEKQLGEFCDSQDLWKDLRFLPTPDMKAYLSVIDILVQPYTSASQSGNTVMAYVEGIPVISTNVGGLAERVKDGETGYVINPGDHQAIANSVVKCFEGDNYAKMSEAARSVAGEQYNWQRIAEQTISVYHS